MNHSDKQPSAMNRPWADAHEVISLKVATPESAAQIPQASSISMASAWQMGTPQAADDALAGRDSSFVYRRDGHPNARELAAKLATLHSANFATVTAQGMSAMAAIALSLLQPGDTVWVANELYGKTTKLFAQDLSKWQIRTLAFDPCSADDLIRLSQSESKLVIVETISNPTLRVPDLPAIVDCAHRSGAKLLVDNTFASHLLCRPLELGADLVMESLSKIVCGHSDCMLGLVATHDREVGQRIQDAVTTFGLTSSPLECYLTHRGLMTLALRMERASANALALANFLASSTSIAHVDYPGLSLHAQHTIASRQFGSVYGWMLTCELHTHCDVNELFARLGPEIAFLPSLGDVCTTLSHPATTSHRSLDTTQLQRLGISYQTIRISCGIEPTAWLLQRFQRALA